jgi:DeoR family deoxyribose operon repressor
MAQHGAEAKKFRAQEKKMGKIDPRTERIRKITDILKANKASSIHDLATSLSVSEMTIRRDLVVLEEKNIIKLIHGGAVFNKPSGSIRGLNASRYYVDRDDDLFLDQKIRIAKKAVSFIQTKDFIFLDAGSTTERMCEYLPDDITVICHAINILESIYSQVECNIIFGGGYYHESTLIFESPQTVQLIKENRTNKAFISARGVDLRLGVTTSNRYETEIKRAAMESSQECILLVDSSKIGKVRPVFFSDIRDFNAIITDDGIPQEYVDAIRKANIELYIV